MFGAPVRSNDASGTTIYKVDVNTTPIGVELEFTKTGLAYEPTAQPRFRTLQNLILSELAKEKDLFKNPPTLASLEAITPNWGFILSGTRYAFSPYAILQSTHIADDKLPCLVDIQLKGLEISRSTIRPVFKLHYLGQAKAEIDFEWPAPTASLADEVVEVSDVAAAADGSVMTLADPAQRRKERQTLKAEIRTAFTAAEEARAAAEAKAKAFYERYEDDLSDAESAFTEWMSDEESESESD
jgi:hypothetical protein